MARNTGIFKFLASFSVCCVRNFSTGNLYCKRKNLWFIFRFPAFSVVSELTEVRRNLSFCWPNTSWQCCAHERHRAVCSAARANHRRIPSVNRRQITSRRWRNETANYSWWTCLIRCALRHNNQSSWAQGTDHCSLYVLWWFHLCSDSFDNKSNRVSLLCHCLITTFLTRKNFAQRKPSCAQHPFPIMWFWFSFCHRVCVTFSIVAQLQGYWRLNPVQLASSQHFGGFHSFTEAG